MFSTQKLQKLLKLFTMDRLRSLFSFSSQKRDSMPSLQHKLLDEESIAQSEPNTHFKKPGWKAMPYVLGLSLKTLLYLF